MAFNVQFGTVVKRHNSTYGGGSGAHWCTLSCALKEESSITNPSLFVDITSSEIFSSEGALNHCYIPLYKRFYFIDNWTYERGKWRADCSIDVLTSFKTEIGNSSQYVLRCASQSDGAIFDALYPIKNNISYSYSNATNPWSIYGGTYVIGTISGGGMGLGCVGYYALTSTQFHSLMSYLFGNIGSYFDLNAIAQDISIDTFKALFNPFQYICSAMYLPFSLSGMNPSQQNIDVGYWTIPVQGGRLTTLEPYSRSFSLAWAGTHPKASRGDYVYCSPYTRVDVDFQPFGHFELPSDVIYSRGGVDIAFKVDTITGIGTCFIGGLIAPIMTITSQVGVPIKLSQMVTDYMNAFTTTAQGVGNTISKVMSGDIGGAIGSGVACIDSSIRAQIPTLSSIGNNGGLSSLVQAPVATYTYYDIVDDDNARNGRPLCKQRTINTLSGYILCNNASVETSGTFEENQEISRLMNTGFYYE